MVPELRTSCLTLLALVCVLKSALGFLIPVHVAQTPTSRVAPGIRRCPVHNAGNFHRRSRCAGIIMGVETNELRLRAAQLGSRLKGTNLYFVGMMGTGKSTIARTLSSVMGRYKFMDTDAVIEEVFNAPVQEIFSTEGEEAFRSVESLVLDKMHSYAKKCIATGGGIVTVPQNWGKLQTGIVVWLDMEPKDIFERLTKDPDQVQKRPLLAGDDPLAKLEALMADRRSQYKQADVRVALEPQQDVEDAILAVIDSVVDFIESNPPKWQEWKERAQEKGVDWA